MVCAINGSNSSAAETHRVQQACRIDLLNCVPSDKDTTQFKAATELRECLKKEHQYGR